MRTYSFLMSFFVAMVSVMATPVKVTFNFEGIDDTRVSGYFSVDNSGSKSTEKFMVYDLEPGKHTFSFSSDGWYFAPCFYDIEFVVGNEDMEINPFEFLGFKKVKFIADGDLIDDINVNMITCDFDIERDYGSSVYFKYTNLTLYKNNGFVAGAYLRPGKYEYSHRGNFLEEMMVKTLTVNDEENVQIKNLTYTQQDWHQVVFNIVDENDNQIQFDLLDDIECRIKNKAGKNLFICSEYSEVDTLYFKDGEYSFLVYKESDSFKNWKPFTVNGYDKEITYQYLEEEKQTVNVKIINAEANKKFKVNFYPENLNNWGGDYSIELTTDNNGNAQNVISVSEGVYDLAIVNPISGYKDKIEVKEECECVIDFKDFKECTILAVDGNGSPVATGEYGNLIIIYKDNDFISSSVDENYNFEKNYKGYLKKGENYEVWCVASGYTASLTNILIGDEHEYYIPLKKIQHNYVVAFNVDDDSVESLPTGRVTIDGITPSGLFFEYSAFVFDVPEGEYNYTIELNRYETIHGTVKVGPETADDGVVYVDFDDALVEKTTSINNTTVKENVFSVYPSVVDDYINISNKNATHSVWNVSLHSASGTVVCRDRILPDSDTASVYVGNLDRGFYLMVIENETGRYTYKIMKR